jgi:DNA ligase (NAD+)
MAHHSSFRFAWSLTFVVWLFTPGWSFGETNPAFSFSKSQASPGYFSVAKDEELTERIARLRAEIARHDELYFKQAEPVISDAAYDRLKQELARLEASLPEAERGARISLVAEDDRSGLFPAYRHHQRMLSLNKCHTERDLRAFIQRLGREAGRGDLAYVIEPKYDGVAISVTYEKGKLVRAVTRGNGEEGDDVTANVLTIASLPHELHETSAGGSNNLIPDLIELRGEIYLPFAEFERINREREEVGESTFANPRNLAAGTLKSLDPTEAAQRRLEIVFYGLGEIVPVGSSPESQQQLHEWIRRWGLPGVGKFTVVRTAGEVCAEVRALGKERARLPFPIDGAVVKLDQVDLQRRLGSSAHAPDWAIAFKFTPEIVETRIKDILVQVGRTGVLTPVAVLNPVQLAGATVSRASLHNRDEIARKDIRVGDFVAVEKAGEIIPVVASVNLSKRTAAVGPFVFPENCPVCGSQVAQSPAEAAVRCPNYDCDAQVRRRLEYFASRAGVGISGLGPATVDRLVALAGVKSIADLYRLSQDGLVVSGVSSEKSAGRLVAAIDRSRTAGLGRFINGLGIPQVGRQNARQLATHFTDLESLRDASREQLQRAGISSSAASGLMAFFQREESRAAVEDLLSVLREE